MAALGDQRLGRPLPDAAVLLLCAAVGLSLVRTTDVPGADVALGSLAVELTLTDAALAAVALVCAARLLRERAFPRPALAPTLAAAAFSAWLLGTAALNGGDAVVSALKLLEYGALALGLVVLVRRPRELWLVVGVLAAVAVAAAVWGALAFFGLVEAEFTGRRQPSFVGEHSLAALSTLTLAVALSTLYVRRHALPRPAPQVAGVAATVGVVLGAALASLLGLYAAVAALVAVGLWRGGATRRALAVTALATIVATLGVLGLRSGDLAAFLRHLGVSEREEQADRNAASWSERLVYAYVGGRIFLDNPITGTGWHGQLPPEEYLRYVPDARQRFPDLPARYFPDEGGFIPQQAYDQVLYELGLVGAFLFLVLGVAIVRGAVRTARAWPRGDPDEHAAYVPATWVATSACVLLGAALFGGSALAAVFWLAIGVAAAGPALVPGASGGDRIASPA